MLVGYIRLSSAQHAAQRRLVPSISVLACHGRVQREGEVMHTITDWLWDLNTR